MKEFFEFLDSWAKERSVLTPREKEIAEGRDEARHRLDSILHNLSPQEPVTGQQLKEALGALDVFLRGEQLLMDLALVRLLREELGSETGPDEQTE